jgi:anti-anti-sigma regulatory factor
MTASDDVHASLPAAMEVGEAAPVCAALLARIEATTTEPVFRLDAAAVERVDAAGVQVLLALRAELAACGRSLRLRAASPALESALALMGLARFDFDPAPGRSGVADADAG